MKSFPPVTMATSGNAVELNSKILEEASANGKSHDSTIACPESNQVASSSSSPTKAIKRKREEEPSSAEEELKENQIGSTKRLHVESTETTAAATE